MSKKLIIGDREYDGDLQPFIGDLRLLKKEFGFGYGTVIERMQSLGDKTVVELFDDFDFLDALVAYIWMVRLRSGERTLTRQDVESEVSLDNFRMVDTDDPGDGVAADPTSAPTDSGRGDDTAATNEAVPLTPASTKTSKRKSHAA